MSMWKLVILVLFIICLTDVASAEKKDLPPLKIGVIAPVSGDFASFGQGVVHAMELANVTESGRELKILVEDNPTCQSPEAATAFHKLTSIDHAQLIVTFCTAAAQAVLGPASAQQVPVIQLTEPGSDPNAYMIKMMPDSAPFVDHLAAMLYKKYKKLAIVANTMEVNTGARGNVPLFTKAFEKLGGKIVFSQDFPDSDLNLRPVILKVRSSGADAVVPFIWPVQQMAAFLKQGDEVNLWSQVKLAGSFVFEFIYPQLFEVYPQIAKLNGLESVNFINETSPQFTDKYKARFSEAAPQFADYAFDATAMIKRCGTDRSCLVSKSSGVSGPIEFGDDSRRVGRFESKQLVNGKFEALSNSSAG